VSAESTWTDVPDGHWARGAIDYVAATNDWMRDFDETTFQPDALETRAMFARAIVKAFAPGEPVDPAITFTDLPPEDPFYPYANVAIRKHWMSKIQGAFRPAGAVATIGVHRALVRALGLEEETAGLDALHTLDGYAFTHRKFFGALNIGILLGLRYNHRDESLDVGPASRLSRAEVAWSLYRAAVMESWRVDDMASFATIELGPLSETERQFVQFGIGYVGYPYIYGGEWYRRSPGGYCCGYQPRGGFDCSGLMWWVMKAPTTYDNSAVRPYPGWPLLDRSSRDMAGAIPMGQRIPWEAILPGDLLLYDGSHDGVVDHVNLYLGNGWALDSSSGYGAVTVMNVAEGWYRDHFVGGRRIMAPAVSEGEASP
jgi:hypothetical protein